jgi:hypothetical protein
MSNRFDRSAASVGARSTRKGRGQNIAANVKACLLEQGVVFESQARDAAQSERESLATTPEMLAILELDRKHQQDLLDMRANVIGDNALANVPAVQPAVAAVAVADRELPVDMAKQTKLAQMFQLQYDEDESKFVFLCGLPGESSDHKEKVAAIETRGETVRIKEYNLESHIEHKHGKPLSAEWWQQTGAAGDTESVKKLVRRAEGSNEFGSPWSLVDFLRHSKKQHRDNDICTWNERVFVKLAAMSLAKVAQPKDFVDAPNKRRQTSLANMIAKGKADIVKIAVAEALLAILEGVSFRAFDSKATMLLLQAAGCTINKPNRKMVRAALDVAHLLALERMEARFHLAQSFTIVFDGWSDRALLNSCVAILYAYLDDNFMQRQLLLDVLPMGDKKHTGEQLAMEIAVRVDLPHQYLYSATTDSAKNVVSAARMLVSNFETLVAKSKSR